VGAPRGTRRQRIEKFARGPARRRHVAQGDGRKRSQELAQPEWIWLTIELAENRPAPCFEALLSLADRGLGLSLGVVGADGRGNLLGQLSNPFRRRQAERAQVFGDATRSA
jgi:hypothetical protein